MRADAPAHAWQVLDAGRQAAAAPAADGHRAALQAEQRAGLRLCPRRLPLPRALEPVLLGRQARLARGGWPILPSILSSPLWRAGLTLEVDVMPV